MGLFIFVLVVGIIIYAVYKYNNINDGIHNNPNNGHQRNNVQSVNRVNNNSNPDIGMMVYFANDSNNLVDNEYRFSYRKVGNGWRAYILKSPTVNGRTASCHRLSDSNGFYICWDRQIYTLREMQTIARYWADLNQKFIATGILF